MTVALLSVAAAVAQPQGKQPNLSPEEMKLVQSIQSATDPAAKLKVVAELIKKFPKTEVRMQVAELAAEQIGAIKDAGQRLSFAQQYLTIFTAPAEEELIFPALISAYADSNQADEGFTKGADFLTRHPDSLDVLVRLLSIGTDQAKKQNGKYVQQSIQYGTHAAELFEADKKPADMDEGQWKTYKTAALSGTYQSLGLLYYASGKRDQAKASYLKASQLAPTEPYNFMMLAALANQEYQDAALRYKTMPSGPARDEELKKTQAMLDQVIDAYAHAIALAEGSPNLQQVRQQYVEDMETYYKYRHGSTEGMQQLIDKYKPTKP